MYSICSQCAIKLIEQNNKHVEWQKHLLGHEFVRFKGFPIQRIILISSINPLQRPNESALGGIRTQREILTVNEDKVIKWNLPISVLFHKFLRFTQTNESESLGRKENCGLGMLTREIDL